MTIPQNIYIGKNRWANPACPRAAYERALKIFKKFLPEGHPNIKVVPDNLDSSSKDAGGENSA